MDAAMAGGDPMGMGFGVGWHANPADELGMLKDEAKNLKMYLDEITRRIEELEKDKKK
jgi:hypothetical protein